MDIHECPHEDCEYWGLSESAVNGHLTVHRREERDEIQS